MVYTNALPVSMMWFRIRCLKLLNISVHSGHKTGVKLASLHDVVRTALSVSSSSTFQFIPGTRQV